MRPHSDWQSEFVTALRDRQALAPPGLRGRGDEIPERRFGVYRNNVHVSLVDALRATFPVVHRLVGDEFFTAMAREHVAEALPRSPVLLWYGAEFPDFIEAFSPADSLPYLSDVARLEWAWHESYHAADARPLEAAALSSLSGTALTSLRLTLHPSLRWLASAWPVREIWRTNSEDEVVHPVDLSGGGETILVLRPDLDVHVRPLPPGAMPFLSAIGEGAELGSAARHALDQDPGFDLRGNLQGLLTIGAFAETVVPGEEE